MVTEVITGDVAEFLSQHSAEAYFAAYMRLARESFSSVIGMTAEVEVDPDDPAVQWVALDVQTKGKVEDVFKEYQAFVARCTEEIPADVSDFFRFGLDFV